MPDLVRSATANAAGTAVIRYADVPSGLVWVISQIGVEAITTTTLSTVVVRKNGRFVTSTNQGQSASAGGLPYVSLKAGDLYTLTWTGLNSGDTAIATLLYNEVTWADFANMGISVV